MAARVGSRRRQFCPRAWGKSDATNFIEQLKAAKPTLEAEQRAGRALLWDRAIDREAQADWADARVAQQPYVYQTKQD